MRNQSPSERVSHAITEQNVDGLKEELQNNGVENIFVRAPNGWTALMVACYRGDYDFARRLLDCGDKREASDIDSDMEEEVLPYIDTVAVEGDVDAINLVDAGYSALHIAIRMGHTDIAIMLLEYGADIHSNTLDRYFDVDEDFSDDAEFSDDDNFSEGHIAKMAQHVAAEKGLVEVLAKLVSLGANIDEKDENDNTALFLASLHGHPDAVKFLLENGANPDIVNVEGGAYW